MCALTLVFRGNGRVSEGQKVVSTGVLAKSDVQDSTPRRRDSRRCAKQGDAFTGRAAASKRATLVHETMDKHYSPGLSKGVHKKEQGVCGRGTGCMSNNPLIISPPGSG